jgi:hypothetical protein
MASRHTTLPARSSILSFYLSIQWSIQRPGNNRTTMLSALYRAVKRMEDLDLPPAVSGQLTRPPRQLPASIHTDSTPPLMLFARTRIEAVKAPPPILAEPSPDA